MTAHHSHAVLIMTRLTHLLSTLTVAALCAGAAVAACGSRAPAPGEMPRLAPRPETVRPNAMPVNVSKNEPIRQPSPVYQAASEGQPLADPPTGAPLDAGTSDSGGGAPLPPLRDGSVPADSRMEPILQRDGGR
jgi:hypothetical protein